MKFNRRFNLNTSLLTVVLVPVVIMLLSLFFAAPREAGAGQEAKYAGKEQCSACHEEVVAAFQDTIHAKKGFELRSDKACETCHGPAGEHVEAGGGKGTIRSFSSLKAEEKSAMCLSCHENGGKMHWQGSAHESRGLACQDCHSVHNPQSRESQLKAAREHELCFTCHKQQSAQFFRSSHHPIREGKMGCADCHNPHGATNAKLIDQPAMTEKCYECHAEKRGPFLWEHMPVREDCNLCHNPHGTNHVKMLNVKEPFVCQRCHSDTRHPGTLYDQSALNTLSNRLFVRSCTNCHQTFHGSNHPSGKTFLR
jgi:DmsE family decaheme c-type cytochrome